MPRIPVLADQVIQARLSNSASSSRTVETPPTRPIKIISLAEQRRLTATANQIARHHRSKNHRCKVCRCLIPRGYNQVTNKNNWHEHCESKSHIRNVQLTFSNWQNGCPTCPGYNFNSQSQFILHIGGKKHAKALRNQDARERLERLNLEALEEVISSIKNT